MATVDPPSIVREFVAGDLSGDDESTHPEDPQIPDYEPESVWQDPEIPDYAPESFWLSKDAELDWFDQNAFIERKDSGKGSVISIPNYSNLFPNSTSGSQRYSVNLKSKPSIIGLPKPQKPNYADCKNRRTCRPASSRLFPNRSGQTSGRTGLALSEPSSPKVSCMGRVRSRKDRSRRIKNRKKPAEPALVKSRSIKERKPGFWKNVRLMFRSKGQKAGGCKGVELDSEPMKRGSSSRKKRGLVDSSSVDGVQCSNRVASIETPGLGGVKRFASGRRSDAWAGDLEGDGAKSEPLVRGSIWRRREPVTGARAPKEVAVERDLHAAGPASV